MWRYCRRMRSIEPNEGSQNGHGISRRIADLAQRRPRLTIGGGLSILLLLAYSLVFQITIDEPLARSVRSALINVIPAVALAAVLDQLLRRFVWRRSPLVQLAVHLPLCLAFSLIWYFAVLVALGTSGRWLEEGFFVRPFASVAAIWQLFQGVTLYVAAVLFSMAIDARERLVAWETAGRAEEAPTSRTGPVMVRIEGEIVAVDPDDIVRISGAGDYSELVTATQTLLSTSTLAEFEAILGEHDFIRAHRSHIVRRGAIVRAESAGNGRMTLHLGNGDDVITSRTGARRLRDTSL